MTTKTAQKIYFVAQEFESNKYGNYQNAQIQVIVRDDDKTLMPAIISFFLFFWIALSDPAPCYGAE